MSAEPIAIVVQGTENVVGHLCGTCRTIHAVWKDMAGKHDASAICDSRQRATHCCAPVCRECSVPIRRTAVLCDPCRAERDAAEEQGRFDAAVKIAESDYSGWVSWDGHGYNEGYFDSIEAVREYCDEEGIDAPEYVWTCAPVAFRVDADAAIDSALEEHHEAADERISIDERKRLQELLNEWAEKQGITSYRVDRTKAVVLDEVTASPSDADR